MRYLVSDGAAVKEESEEATIGVANVVKEDEGEAYSNFIDDDYCISDVDPS